MPFQENLQPNIIEKALLGNSEIFIIPEPIRANCGIPSMRSKVYDRYLINPGTEFIAIFTNKGRNMLMLYHEDVGSSCCMHCKLRRGFYHIFYEDLQQPKIDRETLRRLLFDGTVEGQWQNPLAESYLKEHAGVGIFSRA